ncbi:phenylacetic acid degradation protein PaaN [Streptomyces alkaliphilus]|uniref:Phenylacetic acid degradation protein PaaN n=1 Tax=Streptomyces alkaliphilus TaxID=1472722 RepID=A0A7W3TGN9_9ACTN|nr:phenylacetic acid degradation protein PaaN [Streptomyces alkaliphilus]MBB0246466.1 phenylacetic acid degradation protein PaaN [Streptomyces alkaliphilus]
MTPSLTAARLAERHRGTLDTALETTRTRVHWSPHPENPKAYGGENTAVPGSQSVPEGAAAFEALRDTPFDLDQPALADRVGDEISPYGFRLGIDYPRADLEALLPAMRAAMPGWRAAGPELRALVCVEILARLNARTPEIAHAVMHTTGQAFMMAFQAGGPHALDRGLEAVARAYDEQTRLPERMRWAKPDKRGPVELDKEFVPVGRGVSLLIGCNTFVTWNGYPGLFASLATGNPVLVKPHPRAVLPLALTVRIARETLAEAGFDPNLVALAAEGDGEGIAKELALRPEVRIIDYTGSASFGEWLEGNATQAQVYTEKAGVNTVVIDSTDSYRAMLGNLAFSLSLYSGQMCTTPQNLLIPRDGIDTDEGRKTFTEVTADLAAAVDKLLGDDARAAAVLGAVVNPQVLERIEKAPEQGEAVLTSRAVPHADHPDATIRTPVSVALDGSSADAEGVHQAECFGPVSFAVATDSTADSIALLRRTVRERGAMSVGGYTTSPEVERELVEACLDECAQLSLNLTGSVLVNQTSAFSDLHGSGGNPAANVALVDAAFIANRFRTVEIRRQA